MGDVLRMQVRDETNDPFVYFSAGLLLREHDLAIDWIDYSMDRRLIYCLRNGMPLDMDVYDAAEWSSLVELTEKSALAGGAPVEVPDFTRGRWDVIGDDSFAV